MATAGQHQGAQEILEQSPCDVATRRGELMARVPGPVQCRGQRFFDPGDATVDRVADDRNRI